MRHPGEPCSECIDRACIEGCDCPCHQSAGDTRDYDAEAKDAEIED